ncbi:MAG: hypothetical protein HYU51_16095 [Candidatus Rokubacteria bacterium]|nr:hypothetical protein [Candidatus Rokubacteria bacterium]
MTLNSFDAVFYTLAFLVPGFLADSVANTMVRKKAIAHEVSLLRFLTLSCLNYAVWSWLVYLVVRTAFFLEHPIRSAAAWFLVIFVSPVALGAMLGVLSQRNTIRRLLDRLGIYTVHPIPTAWDDFFSTTGPVWVLVTLKDGSSVGGRFGARSFASSDSTERDLFVESVYRVEERGAWTEVPLNAGIWIRGDEIQHVEFWEFR